MLDWFNREKKDIEGHFHEEKKVSMATETLSYVGGNKNSPVLILGDAPDSEDGTKNILVIKLGTSEVVPADSISDEVPVPTSTVTNTGAETSEELDAQIAALEAQKATLDQQPPQG